jgi:hypothetical protein
MTIDANDIAREHGPDGLRKALDAAGSTPDNFKQQVMTEGPVTGDVIRAKVTELANMDEADYLACKKAEAKELGIGVGELDKLVKAARSDGSAVTGAGRKVAFEDPDPWSEPVDGPALANAMVREIKRYCAMGGIIRRSPAPCGACTPTLTTVSISRQSWE